MAGHVDDPIIVSQAERAALQALVDAAMNRGRWPSERDWARRVAEVDRAMISSLQARDLLLTLPSGAAPSRNGLRASGSDSARAVLKSAEELHASLLRLESLARGQDRAIAEVADELAVEVGLFERLVPLITHGGGVRVGAWHRESGRPQTFIGGDIVSQTEFRRLWSEQAEPVFLSRLRDVQIWYDAGTRRIHNLRIDDAWASGLRIPGLTLSKCRFVQCRFGDLVAPEIELIDCRFEICEMLAATLRGAVMNNTSFIGCNLAGSRLEAATFDRVAWTGSNVNGIRLSPGPASTQPRLADAKLRGVYFGSKYVSRARVSEIARKKRAAASSTTSPEEPPDDGPRLSVGENSEGGFDIRLRGLAFVSNAPGNAAKILQRLVAEPNARVHSLELCCILDGFDWGRWHDVKDVESAIQRMRELRLPPPRVEKKQEHRLVAVLRAIGARLDGKASDDLGVEESGAGELIEFLRVSICVTGSLPGEGGPLKNAKKRIYSALNRISRKDVRDAQLRAIGLHISETVTKGEWVSYGDCLAHASVAARPGGMPSGGEAQPQ